MEEMKAALSAKGYDLVGTADAGSDSEDDVLPGRIPSLEPNQAREKGNEAFKKGKYDRAIKYWQGGLKSILSALCSGPEAMSNTSLSELDLTLNLNIAMAYMKKNEFEAADRSVDKALARRDALPTHQITKALYRKALAQRAMHRLDETLTTLKDLLEVEPGNAAALQMNQEVEREWTRQKKAQKENLKKVFSKMQGEDQKANVRLREEREEARRRSGVAWTSEDLDTAAFERGDIPIADGKDWGLALSRTILWSIEQLAVEGNVILPAEQTQASIWFVGVSSTCELRWLTPSVLMSRLPSLSTLELVLVGFLGEYDPQNKRIPDPRAENLPKSLLYTKVSEDPPKEAFVRIVKGSLQDALTKELKVVAEAVEAATNPPASSEPTVDSAEEKAQASETPADSIATEAEVATEVEASGPPPAVPSVCVIAHPQLHRYLTDFHPAISWLVRHKVPTVVIGASEPDLSWKQDETLLKALGANIVVSKRECPYPMCLPDNPAVRKCNHIIGFVGGKALERDKLTKTKIELLSQDYTVC
jgi:tetratricopeptide (TPR) repeat protein